MTCNFAFALSLSAALLTAQSQRPAADPDGVDSALRGANQTMKQLARGTQYAAASMMPQATSPRSTSCAPVATPSTPSSPDRRCSASSSPI